LKTHFENSFWQPILKPQFGKTQPIFRLMWQIIEIGLMAGVDLATNPNLVVLLEEDETLADLERLGPEAILLRWVNYHLARDPKYEAGPITNFKKDIRGEFSRIF